MFGILILNEPIQKLWRWRCWKRSYIQSTVQWNSTCTNFEIVYCTQCTSTTFISKSTYPTDTKHSQRVKGESLCCRLVKLLKRWSSLQNFDKMFRSFWNFAHHALSLFLWQNKQTIFLHGDGHWRRRLKRCRGQKSMFDLWYQVTDELILDSKVDKLVKQPKRRGLLRRRFISTFTVSL